MKIIHVIPYFAPQYGGPVTALYQLSAEMAKKGHQVTIVTSDMNYDKKYIQKLEESGVEILPFHTVVNFGLFIYTPSMKKWVKKNLRQYDIIHLHSFRAYQNSLITKYAIEDKIPIILQARGSVLPFFEKQFLKHIYDFLWGYTILKNASMIIALCETEAEQYQTMGVPRKKIRIIPNGIDLSQFSNLPGKGTFRLKYDISENEKIVLFLGRIHKIKGIDLLIDTYFDLLQELPDVRLVIAGADDGFLSVIKDKIQQKNPKKIPLLTGPLYNQDKLAAYIDADVFVLPSRYETFPNTVLEAWACGTPVIVTKGCLIADIIEKAGYVTSFNSIELKAAILKTFTHEKERVKNINSGLALIKTELNLSACVQKIEEIYKETIMRNN